MSENLFQEDNGKIPYGGTDNIIDGYKHRFKTGQVFTVKDRSNTKYRFSDNDDLGAVIIEFGPDPIEVDREIIRNRFAVRAIGRFAVLVHFYVLGQLVEVSIRYTQMKFQN